MKIVDQAYEDIVIKLADLQKKKMGEDTFVELRLGSEEDIKKAEEHSAELSVKIEELKTTIPPYFAQLGYKHTIEYHDDYHGVRTHIQIESC
ncbi:MAG: hypothetical protein FWE31_05225 [Firmicutes bacterium]|nr:hypothetical protein [Bacillota bacterium]